VTNAYLHTRNGLVDLRLLNHDHQPVISVRDASPPPSTSGHRATAPTPTTAAVWGSSAPLPTRSGAAVPRPERQYGRGWPCPPVTVPPGAPSSLPDPAIDRTTTTLC
jgi:hypothetical protein